MNKSLVCYFSATNTTKKVAEEVALILKCDLFEIEALEKYTDDDLDWNNKNSRSSVEMADLSSRPKVKNKIANINDYDTIILGFPVWWYREPTIVDTFIEENNLEGKKVYVFVTSGGSTVDGSLKSLRNGYNNINFVSGKRLRTGVLPDEILDWIK